MTTETIINEKGEMKEVVLFSLEGSKAADPATGKQIKYAEALAKKTKSKLPTTSQMAKYCEMDVLSEAIDAMKSGKEIELS